MHFRFFVTFNKQDAANSEQARNLVIERLHEEHFCCGEGRWSRGMADWFIIGGRWSGALSRSSWAKDISAQMKAMEKEHDVQVWGAFYGDLEKQKIQRELAARFQEMWDGAAPAEYIGIPVQRNTYQEHGHKDDAMILTKDIYEGLLKEYQGSEDSEHHADLDYEPVTAEMIGRKWIVVVDYHS